MSLIGSLPSARSPSPAVTEVNEYGVKKARASYNPRRQQISVIVDINIPQERQTRIKISKHWSRSRFGALYLKQHHAKKRRRHPGPSSTMREAQNYYIKKATGIWDPLDSAVCINVKVNRPESKQPKINIPKDWPKSKYGQLLLKHQDTMRKCRRHYHERRRRPKYNHATKRRIRYKVLHIQSIETTLTDAQEENCRYIEGRKTCESVAGQSR